MTPNQPFKPERQAAAPLGSRRALRASARLTASRWVSFMLGHAGPWYD